jgi:CRP-like cAMP-binding protein
MSHVLPGKVISEKNAKKFDVFQGLTREQVLELNSWLQRKELGPNQYVFKEGDKPDGLYLLCQGHVMIVKETVRGKFKLAELEAPNFFGEMAFMSKLPRSAAARTVNHCVLGFLPNATFQQKIVNNNLTAFSIGLNIGKLLAERLQDTNQALSKKAAISMRMKWG